MYEFSFVLIYDVLTFKYAYLMQSRMFGITFQFEFKVGIGIYSSYRILPTWLGFFRKTVTRCKWCTSAKARLLGAALPKHNSCHHCEEHFAVCATAVNGDVKVFCPSHAEKHATVFGKVAGQTCILQMSRLACPNT